MRRSTTATSASPPSTRAPTASRPPTSSGASCRCAPAAVVLEMLDAFGDDADRLVRRAGTGSLRRELAGRDRRRAYRDRTPCRVRRHRSERTAVGVDALPEVARHRRVRRPARRVLRSRPAPATLAAPMRRRSVTPSWCRRGSSASRSCPPRRASWAPSPPAPPTCSPSPPTSCSARSSPPAPTPPAASRFEQFDLSRHRLRGRSICSHCSPGKVVETLENVDTTRINFVSPEVD